MPKNLILWFKDHPFRQLAGVFLVILLLTLPYFINFSDGISPLSDDWSAFGGYLSGISGSISLIVTVYIAFELSNLDGKRSAQALEYEKQRFLAEQRIQTLRDLRSELGLLIAKLNNGDYPEAHYEILKASLNFSAFWGTNLFLFPSAKTPTGTEELTKEYLAFQSLLRVINDLVSSSFSYYSETWMNEQTEEGKLRTRNRYKETIAKLEQSIQIFNSQMLQYILGGMK